MLSSLDQAADAQSVPCPAKPDAEGAVLVHVRGMVQGVGFRPAVWRLAQQHRLQGWVANDGAGVSALLCGTPSNIAAMLEGLRRSPPALARIDAIEHAAAARPPNCTSFEIVTSRNDAPRTGVVPDAATCSDCCAEIHDPAARRYRYPFANCTACGPRLSIITAIPYDRATTTMRAFTMCPACAAEYADPADRRFHAQPIACPACGPRVWLEPRADGDPIQTAHNLLLSGGIVAIKAIGGFHLACDATNAAAVARLRHAKRRDAKPFALMGRDLSVIRRYAILTDAEAVALQSPAAPIVLLSRRQSADTALPGVAPGLAWLGFMLPATPLHHLLLSKSERPLVMTSGNLADEPQCIGNHEATQRLGVIADHVLLHDRDITRQVDDSVVRMMGGRIHVLRRARGYAPAPLPLPPGFAAAPAVLAMGGELKSTFCLLRDGDATLSQHIGDLENAPTLAEYRRSITDYRALFVHQPAAIAVDSHPDYLSSRYGREVAARETIPVIEVQHHHAHFAACLAENGVPADAGPMLGIVLDGMGWGDDGTIRGGEVLYGDYREVRRLACLKPVGLPGGARAIREPWRNALAQIAAALGWPVFTQRYADTELHRFLATKPVSILHGMIERSVNTPLSSSCGRLFDAVAAAIGLHRDAVQYEGQAAMSLEAIADIEATAHEGGYPFDIVQSSGILWLDPAPLWAALLEDLAAGTQKPLIAARFHLGLAAGLARLVGVLNVAAPVALSGGVFQNKALLELLMNRLAAQGSEVLTHHTVPANDGGLALGQAVIATARLMSGRAMGG